MIEPSPEAPQEAPQPHSTLKTSACDESSLNPFPSSENDGALANMRGPSGASLRPPGPPGAPGAPSSPDSFSTTKGREPTPEGGPSDTPSWSCTDGSESCRVKGRGSSSSVVSLMSEDGEVEEERTPSPRIENKAASRPRRSAALRSKRSATAAAADAAATAATATPPPVPAKYRDELEAVDRDIMQILNKGIAHTDLLSNREEYIKIKKALVAPEGEEEAEGEGEQPQGTGLVLQLQRLLRVFCEGSSLPISELAEAASAALADKGPEGDAPAFAVDAQTLKVELPVLLTRRRFGLVRPIEAEGAPAAAGGGRAPPVGPLEDTAAYKLWIWECVLLDGLPAAFKEAARREREARQTLYRRLRALEKLREALCGGVEGEIAAARERVQQQLQREAAAAERKQQQEHKKRQIEYVRMERERGRRQREEQREEQRRQKEAEREKRERERQEKEREKEEQRLQRLQQQAEKQKTKKTDPSVNRQQSLMASWLRRPAAPAGGSGLHTGGGPPGSSQGSRGPTGGAPQSPGGGGAPGGECPLVVVLDEEEQADIRQKAELRKAAEAEAVAWRVAPEDKEGFVGAVERLASCALQRHRRVDSKELPQFIEAEQQQEQQQNSEPSRLLQQFVERHAAPSRDCLREFVSFCVHHRRFVHKIPPPQSEESSSSSSGSSSISSSSSGWTGSGYRQSAADVRRGLTLTDYCADSLPDAPFLRSVWMALDDWKRPVRKLLMPKQPKCASCCEQWAEESCVDYERDSDDEWFECFDADDLDDAKEEEEEEEIEAEEDRDWLEEDEENKDKQTWAAAPPIKFASFLNWKFSFDGEPRPNENDASVHLVAFPSLRDGNWASAYGCIGHDWGGNPFAKLDVLPISTRRRWSDEDSINLLKFFHGKTVGKLRNISEFQRANRHVTKAEVERQLKQYMVYERRAEDRQRRWYATEEAARAFNLSEDLEIIFQSIRTEEKIVEAKQQELAEQLKAQLAANNAILDTDDKKMQHQAHATTSPNEATTTQPTPSHAAAATPAAAPAAQAAAPAAAAAPATGGSSCNKLEAFFVKRAEAPDEQQQAAAQAPRGTNAAAAAGAAAAGTAAELRPGPIVQQLLQQKKPPSSCGDSVTWPADEDTAVAAAAAGIAAKSAAAAAAAAAAGQANSQGAALAAHVAAAALLAAKLARGAAELGEGSEAPRASVDIDGAPVQQGQLSAQSVASALPAGGPGARSSSAFVASPLGAPTRYSADGRMMADYARSGAGTPGVVTTGAEEDLDKISAGKRMRKSAVMQGPHVDVPGDAAPKRVKRRQSAMSTPTTTTTTTATPATNS